MPLTLDVKSIEWWFWAVTLVFIILALFGWVPGYYVVMVISVIQIIYFAIKEGSIIAFPTQVRIVYFAVTLFGLWSTIRFPLYIFILLGTTMVTFADRCVLALGLKYMPWNRNIAPGDPVK